MSELVWAIKNGDIEQVTSMIENKKFDINQEFNKRFPVHYAADYGQAQVLDYLISKGADVDAKDKHGITPLLAAIWEGHTCCVTILLKHGASKNGSAPDGTNYLDAAEKPEIKQLLN